METIKEKFIREKCVKNIAGEPILACASADWVYAFFEPYLSIPIEPLVMQKIAEAFNRYLRSESEYPFHKWSDKEIEQYDEDKKYRRQIYEENRITCTFSYAAILAKRKLFEKIIKETLDSNFSA